MSKLVVANKKKFVIFLSSFLILFFILIGLVIAVFYFNYQIHARPKINNPDKIFVVEKGQGLKEIALNLEKKGWIKNDFWFILYILFQGKTRNIMAGEYFLNDLSLLEIAEKITGGQSISNEIEVTIPEGFTLKKIDARLASRGLIEGGEILQKPELEGYLFPDTYRFQKDADVEEIISKMRDNFDKKLNQELRDEVKRQGKTIEEIIIMASLLEKEVPSYEDRQIVSGIFWQRLKDNYPLQSCATIAYILDIDKWRYSTKDIEVDSPYNTYKNIGLPPGPINNPGLSAIKAAIYPQATDYYFFLSAPNSETIFSKTLEEHNENKAKYLQ